MKKKKGVVEINPELVKMLRLYRCYKYAAENSGKFGNFNSGPRVPYYVNSDRMITLDEWDFRRYSMIVHWIDGAVAEVLDDRQQVVIRRMYLNRNKKKLKEIAAELHVDPSTVSRWHSDALEQLTIALAPLRYEEIVDFSHVFDRVSA